MARRTAHTGTLAGLPRPSGCRARSGSTTLGELPKVALLYASVEGFLDLPLVGRLFVSPVRAAADAQGA